MYGHAEDPRSEEELRRILTQVEAARESDKDRVLLPKGQSNPGHRGLHVCLSVVPGGLRGEGRNRIHRRHTSPRLHRRGMEVLLDDCRQARSCKIYGGSKMKIKRKKVGDRAYNLFDEKGELIAHAVQTGEHGRDSYPWDWYMEDGWEFDTDKRVDTVGSAESLRYVVQHIEGYGNYYGMRKAKKHG